MTVESTPPADESPITLVGKIVAVFLVVGAGLGGATLIFLSATGVFDVTASDDLEALGQQFLGGIAIATVLVFGLLIGIVLAALGGMYAANRSPDRGISAAVGAIAGTLGHIALVAGLGVMLIVGVEALEPSESEAALTPTPIATRSPQEIASCQETFGAGSELCVDETTDESADEDSGVSFEDIWRIGLGLIPAAAVGGLSGAIAFTRRTVPIADAPFVRFEPPAEVNEPSTQPVERRPLPRARPRKVKPPPAKPRTRRKPVTHRPSSEPEDLTDDHAPLPEIPPE